MSNQPPPPPPPETIESDGCTLTLRTSESSLVLRMNEVTSMVLDAEGAMKAAAALTAWAAWATARAAE